MKAIQVQTPGGPEALISVDLPEPQPSAGQIRVRAHAIGVGRADVLIRQGTYKWMPPLPAIPGAELAGEIDALGSGVTNWKIGDRVLVSARELEQRGGCYAQAMVVSADAPYRLPESIDFADALSLPNLQLALALMRVAGASLKPDLKQPAILITGASGGVATMLSQLAKHRGFQTIGTSRSVAKQQFALQHGFDFVLNTSPTDWAVQVKEITGNAGVAFAFDHLGGESLMACLNCLAPLGTVVSYNAITGMPSEDVFAQMRRLLGRSLALRCFSMHTLDQYVQLRRELMMSAIDLMATKKIKAPAPQLLRLDQVRTAHEMLDKGEVSGKIVLV